MRRRERPEPEIASSDAPRALVIGPCVEVWADDGSSLLDAFRRYQAARGAFERANELDARAGVRILGPAGGPWRLSDENAERRAGMHRAEIAGLRKEADRLSPAS